MASGARGEVFLEIGEKRYIVLFTNRAIAEAERATGKSIIGMAQGFSQGEVGVYEVAHLLQAGLEAGRREARIGGKQFSMNDAYRLMDAVGFTEVTAAIFGAVTEVLSYHGEEAAGRDEEENPT